jgi:hypothetical protein
MNPNPAGCRPAEDGQGCGGNTADEQDRPQEQSSLRYWCRMLGATPLEICRAVESVGSDPAAVRAHLKRRKDPIRLRTRRVPPRSADRLGDALDQAAVAAAILGMHGRARSFRRTDSFLETPEISRPEG